MDGHLKDAIPSGVYDYEYTLDQRAGTHWYHLRPHRITGEQVYKGLSGLNDEEEAALNLPAGSREIPLVIQDRRVDDSGKIVFNLSMPERMMTGFLGDLILVNGIPNNLTFTAAPSFRKGFQFLLKMFGNVNPGSFHLAADL